MFSYSTLLTVAFAGLASSAPLMKRAHQGQATFYAVGLGNCGGTNSANEMVVALNTAMYGSTSQRSGYCGQTVHITNENNGQTQTATVVDSCPTCGGGDLDMSTGLFGALGGTQDQGVFPISWTIGGESSSSSSSSNNNNNNNNNSNNSNNNSSSSSNDDSNNEEQDQQSSSSSHSHHKQTPTSSSSAPKKTSSKSTSAPAPTQTQDESSLPTDQGIIPTGVSPNHTDTGIASWWAEIDSSVCGFLPADNETIAAIAPSTNYNGTDLSMACGKYIIVFNDENGKNVTARVASWMPNAENGTLALTDGYKAIADMNGGMPSPITNEVRWGFVDFGLNSTRW